MRAIKLIFLSLLLTASWGLWTINAPWAGEPVDPKGIELLKKGVSPSGSLNFRGVEIQILVGRDGVPRVKKFSVQQKGDTVSRMAAKEGTQPAAIHIKNKYGTWIYNTRTDRLVKDTRSFGLEKNFNVTKRDRFKRIQENYNIRFIKEKVVAGRKCEVYAFRPKEKGRLVRECWLDTESGLPLRVDTFGPDGRLLNITSFESIEFDPKQPSGAYQSAATAKGPVVPEDKLLEVILVPPRELKEAVGDGVIFPDYVPRGYRLRNVFVKKKNDRKIYQMLYSDGIVPLSIFQEEEARGDLALNAADREVVIIGPHCKGYFDQKGLVKMFCFTINNTKNTIIGEIDKREMEKIAESFLPVKKEVR